MVNYPRYDARNHFMPPYCSLDALVRGKMDLLYKNDFDLAFLKIQMRLFWKIYVVSQIGPMNLVHIKISFEQLFTSGDGN